jgi:hypothetical protein
VNVTVNKAIHSLNLLFAGGEDFPRSTVENWVQLPLCQKDTLSHILAVVKDVGPPQLVASGPEALSNLALALLCPWTWHHCRFRMERWLVSTWWAHCMSP